MKQKLMNADANKYSILPSSMTVLARLEYIKN